jgi:cell wall-associated NlpC family hydrolase
VSYYFDNPDHVLALQVELVRWIGTPFLEGAGRRAKEGVCADCVSFCEAVLVNLGAINPIEWPRYVMGGGKAMLTLLLSRIKQIPELEQVSTDAVLLPGDLMVYSGATGIHHVAIYAGSQTLWHCALRYNVTTNNVNDPKYRGALIALFRAKAKS